MTQVLYFVKKRHAFIIVHTLIKKTHDNFSPHLISMGKVSKVGLKF